ncbi:MAG: adenylate kinase family protein [Candidatus Bathyarchaeia archaeon]
MSSRRRVFLVAGVPGTGKTAVAIRLASRIEGTNIELSELAKREGLVTGFDELRETYIVDPEGMREKISQVIEDGERPLVFDGHFAPEVVPPETVLYAFVLRRAPWKLEEELRSRGYSEGKVRENVEAELLDVCLVEAVENLGPERVCEVDTTGKKLEETVEEIMAIIQGTKPCRYRIVDWLSHDESRRLLGGDKGRTSL